jgi:hypothetical protein
MKKLHFCLFVLLTLQLNAQLNTGLIHQDKKLRWTKAGFFFKPTIADHVYDVTDPQYPKAHPI